MFLPCLSVARFARLRIAAERASQEAWLAEHQEEKLLQGLCFQRRKESG